MMVRFTVEDVERRREERSGGRQWLEFVNGKLMATSNSFAFNHRVDSKEGHSVRAFGFTEASIGLNLSFVVPL